jgi:hypothetical protein
MDVSRLRKPEDSGGCSGLWTVLSPSLVNLGATDALVILVTPTICAAGGIPY